MISTARRAAVLAAIVAAAAAGAADHPFIVVVHPASGVTTLTVAELSAALLGRTPRWPDGTRVNPVDQLPDSATYKAVAEEIHGRSPAELRSFWVRQVFAGKGAPPPAKGSDEDVVAFVRNNPGAVGYVSPGADTRGVKVVKLRD